MSADNTAPVGNPNDVARLSSFELWGGAKFIGRECATENKNYIMCKIDKGEHPDACMELGNMVAQCSERVVDRLYEVAPKEFRVYQYCLDSNDFKNQACRVEEKKLVDAWNAAQKK